MGCDRVPDRRNDTGSATIAAVAGLVYAHQGGWDEILMVLVPLLVIAGLLAVAKRRAVTGHGTERDVSSDEPIVDRPLAD